MNEYERVERPGLPLRVDASERERELVDKRSHRGGLRVGAARRSFTCEAATVPDPALSGFEARWSGCDLRNSFPPSPGASRAKESTSSPRSPGERALSRRRESRQLAAQSVNGRFTSRRWRRSETAALITGPSAALESVGSEVAMSSQGSRSAARRIGALARAFRTRPSRRACPLRSRARRVCAKLLERLAAQDHGAWRRDAEAAALMGYVVRRYAKLARKHGLDPWDAAAAAFDAMRSSAVRNADDPWAVVTRAVQVTLIAEERANGLLCSVYQARRPEFSSFHDPERFSDRENPLSDYHPALRVQASRGRAR